MASSHKTGKHAVRKLSIPGIQPGSATKPVPYTSGIPAAPISPVGAKALGARAKSVLKPLADPSEAP